MSQAFLASSCTLIGRMGASETFQWVEDYFPKLSPDESRIVESYRKRNTQRQMAQTQLSVNYLDIQSTEVG